MLTSICDAGLDQIWLTTYHLSSDNRLAAWMFWPVRAEVTFVTGMSRPVSAEQLKSLAEQAKAWPFAEARALQERMAKLKGDDPDRPVLFETGYGPSGLPHIGTFGEVVRTSMVRHAFECLTGRKTRLVCFSDDMDGLRKVPDNVPNPDKIDGYLQMPLTKVPDPFGTHASFGAHNNARLQAFLDSFGFDYEFISATDMYTSGQFDKALLDILANYEAVTNVILPTLGPERRETYSPFLPVCPRTGRVLQAAVTAWDTSAGSITYSDPETQQAVTVPVTGGHCKLQWKADWAMRWYALGVDYEMSGKDLIDSVTLSSKIVRTLKATPPAGFSYELFLDQNGEKISKSKGNGLSVEDWLRYGNPESLALFMYGQPKRAKRLYFDLIPKTVDEYYTHKDKLAEAEAAAKLENPAWHIRLDEAAQTSAMPVSFSLLLNLAAVCSAETPATLWGYIRSYAPETSPETHPELDRLAGYAVQFYQDRVRPTKQYRLATDTEKGYITALRDALAKLPQDAAAQDVQAVVYAAGKEHYENLRDWFTCLYETMLGQTQGPRMGSFFRLYGLHESVSLCDKVLADALVDAD